MAKEGIPSEDLDNGVLSCADYCRLQQLCNGLSRPRDRRLAMEMAGRVPHAFLPKDRAAGYRYVVWILQAEFSLPRPLSDPTPATCSSRR